MVGAYSVIDCVGSSKRDSFAPEFPVGLSSYEYHPIEDLDTGATGDPRTAFKPDLYRSRYLGRDKDQFVRGLLNLQLIVMGQDTIGLEGSPIDAKLLSGSYSPMHTRGWTEFEIEADRSLLITTYGIDGADESPGAVPVVVGKFRVTPR